MLVSVLDRTRVVSLASGSKKELISAIWSSFHDQLSGCKADDIVLQVPVAYFSSEIADLVYVQN